MYYMLKCPLIFILTFLVFAGLASCEKEYSNELGGPPVSPGAGDLLVSALVNDGVSEARYTYQYNPSDQILNSLLNITSTMVSGDLNVEATRDAAGKLTKSRYVIKTTLNPLGDTLFYQLFRNASGRVSHAIVKGSESFALVAYDSLVYSYTANRLSGFTTFFIDNISGSVEPAQKFEFTYTGANMTKAIEYELLGSVTSQKLIETITMEYDTNPAAMVVGEEEYMLGLLPANALFPSVNNLKRYERKYEGTPELNSINTFNYTYGTNRRPISAEVTTSRVGLPDAKGTMAFTYQ
jgi:hypothetical protein